MSIWMAVIPSLVPATLKSMSPPKSSSSWISERILKVPVSGSVMSPMAMPETGAAMGTPASMSERVDPQTDAMEEDPLDSRISVTTRMV